MFCPKCGKENVDGAAFCMHCGSAIPSNTSQEKTSGKKVMLPSGIIVTVDDNNKPIQPAPQPPIPNPTPRRPMADPRFTKFIEQPLPFRGLKIVMGIVCLVASIYSFYVSFQNGAWEILRNRAAVGMNIVSVGLGVAWFLVAIISFFTKYNRGLTTFAGVALLFSAGIAYTCQEVLMDMGVPLAIMSASFSVLYLISAAGGVNINV